MRFLPVLCAFLATGCIGAGAPADGTRPAARWAGAHVEVLCHVSCGADSTRVVAVAESAWARSAEVFGGLRSYRPVTIHLVDSAGYAEADRRYNGGARLANGAFSEQRSRSAWITVSPAALAEHANTLGLPAHTLRGIAHEVYHLVSYQALQYGTALPDWLAEGGAVWVEQATAQALGVLAPVEEDPWASTLYWLAADRLPVAPATWLADFLAEGPETVGADSGDYGLRLALFAFLKEEEPALLDRLIQAAREAQSRSFVSGGMAVVARGTLTKTELEDLHDRFTRRVAEGRNRAGWLEGRRHLGTAGDVWRQGGFGEASAVALRWGQPLRAPYRVRGVLEPLTGEESSFTVMVDWTAGSALHVTLRGDGLVTLRQHLGNALEKEPARILARGGNAARPLTGPVPFEVRVLEDQVVVLLDGVETARGRRRPRVGPTRWGLAVSAQGAALWRNVVAETFTPPAELEVRVR